MNHRHPLSCIAQRSGCILLLCGAAAIGASSDSNPPDSIAVGELDPIVITDDRVLPSDATAEPAIISGVDIRAGARTTPLEELSQQSADVYVTSRGAGLHGVASGASGGIHIRGLGGSPNSQVLVVEDGVPDYQGIFPFPTPSSRHLSSVLSSCLAATAFSMGPTPWGE